MYRTFKETLEERVKPDTDVTDMDAPVYVSDQEELDKDWDCEWVVTHLTRYTLDYSPLTRYTQDYTPLTRYTLDYTHLTRYTLDYTHLTRYTLDYTHLTRYTLDYTHLTRYTQHT